MGWTTDVKTDGPPDPETDGPVNPCADPSAADPGVGRAWRPLRGDPENAQGDVNPCPTVNRQPSTADQ